MISNKKAYHNYELKDTIEAGIVLRGMEVKSIRDNRANLSEAFVRVVGGKLVLINAEIPRYKFSGGEEYNPTRTRELLVHKKELERFQTKAKAGGLTMVPVKLYFSGNKVKVLVALARGKKTYEKKLAEKQKDLDRDFEIEKKRYMI